MTIYFLVDRIKSISTFVTPWRLILVHFRVLKKEFMIENPTISMKSVSRNVQLPLSQLITVSFVRFCVEVTHDNGVLVTLNGPADILKNSIHIIVRVCRG